MDANDFYEQVVAHRRNVLGMLAGVVSVVGLSGCAPRSAPNDVRSSKPKEATFLAHLTSIPQLGEGTCAYFFGTLGLSDLQGRTFEGDVGSQMCKVMDPPGLDTSTLDKCNRAYAEATRFPVVIRAQIIDVEDGLTEVDHIVGKLRVDEVWFRPGAPLHLAELMHYQRTLAEAFPGIPTSLGIFFDGADPIINELEEGSPVLVGGLTRIPSREIGWVELPERAYLAPFKIAISGDLLRDLADVGHNEPTLALVWGNIKITRDEEGNRIRSISASRIAFEYAPRD